MSETQKAVSCGGVAGGVSLQGWETCLRPKKLRKSQEKQVKFLYRCEEISIYPNREEKVSLERNRN